jgi:hypothetical protein
MAATVVLLLFALASSMERCDKNEQIKNYVFKYKQFH